MLCLLSSLSHAVELEQAKQNYEKVHQELESCLAELSDL